MRRLSGWTRTGGPQCRGRETPRMPDGSPNWSLPAHEPDNSPRAIAGRLLALAALYVGGAVVSGAGLWLINQPPAQDAMTRLLLVMPGPGVVWQAAELVAALVVGAALTVRLGRLRRPASGRVRVRVQVLADTPDPGIPTGQLVYRRFDSAALAGPSAHRALRDAGAVEIETLLFRLIPPFLLLVALLNATTGSGHQRATVWPLLAGALVLAWVGRRVQRGHAVHSPAARAEPGVPICDSCEQAPGSITVAFPDGPTFHVCALCLHAGTSRAPGSNRPSPSTSATEVQL